MTKKSDEYLGYTLRPGKSFVWRSEDTIGEKVVSANSWGFRDDEWSTTEPGIVFLGDSFVEARQVDFLDTFHSLVEDVVTTRCHSVGVSGWSTVHCVLALRSVVTGLAIPNRIYYVFCHNDIVDNIEASSRAKRRVWMARASSGRVVLDRYVNDYPRSLMVVSAEWLIDRSALAGFVYSAARSVKTGRIYRDSTRIDPTNTVGWDLFRAGIREMRDFGVPFTIILINPLTQGEGEIYNLAITEIEAAGIDYIDLRAANPDRPNGGHWSPLGHQVVASEILRHLRKVEKVGRSYSGPVSRSPKPGTEVRILTALPYEQPIDIRLVDVPPPLEEMK